MILLGVFLLNSILFINTMLNANLSSIFFVNVMAPSPNESYLLTFFASFQARRCHSVD